MTLQEYVERLPDIHRARREYDRLRARVERLEKALKRLYFSSLNEMAARNLPWEWIADCAMDEARVALGYEMPTRAALKEGE